MRSLLVKLACAVVIVGVLGWLFVRSLHSTRAEPYALDGSRLTGWTLAVEAGADPAGPAVVLRGPQEIVSMLFRQVFTRTMESLNAPVTAAIPVVLRGELASLAPAFDIDGIVEAAREAGLERAVFEPRCLAHRRISQPGVIRQAYLVVFASPAYDEFRRSLGARAAGPGFDPASLAPVMFVAGSDTLFHRWLPLGAEVEDSCLAPIHVE